MLSDRERETLHEIQRQFWDEDPNVAHSLEAAYRATSAVTSTRSQSPWPLLSACSCWQSGCRPARCCSPRWPDGHGWRAAAGSTKAVVTHDVYLPQIQELALRQVDADEALRTLIAYDARWACDVLHEVYARSSGVDGRVSVDLDPRSDRECWPA